MRAKKESIAEKIPDQSFTGGNKIMKKKIIALLLAGCMAATAGCGGTEAATKPAGDAAEESTAEAASEEYSDGQETTAKELKADANGVLSNGLFSITMPKDTEGIYVAYGTDDSIEICDKEASESGFGGFVFSIQGYADPEEYSGGLDVKKGEMTDSKGTIYDITVVDPTDVQWDFEKSDKMPDTYAKLASCEEDVIKSLKSDVGGEFVYGGGTKGEELYGDVIAQFRKAISEGWDAQKLEDNDMSTIYFVVTQTDDNIDPMKATGYAYMDINADGIDELVTGEIEEAKTIGTVYDIYTMVNRKPAHVVSGWDRNRYYLSTGTIIVNDFSDSAASSGRIMYILTPNTTELFPQIGVKYDATEDESKPWYVSHSPETDEWESITEAEYDEYMGRNEEAEKIDLTPFAE